MSLLSHQTAAGPSRITESLYAPLTSHKLKKRPESYLNNIFGYSQSTLGELSNEMV